jgi:hypothetical protein
MVPDTVRVGGKLPFKNRRDLIQDQVPHPVHTIGISPVAVDLDQ